MKVFDRAARTFLLAAALFACATAVDAQQLTTVAVFDLEKVMLSFYQDSEPMRKYIAAQDQYRNDLTQAQQRLSDYQTRRANALDQNDTRTAERLRQDIDSLQQDIAALQERWYSQQEDLKNQLMSQDFYKRLYDTVGYVAQDNGYTAVLESGYLKTGLFWYSPAIDITNDVIQELLARYR